MASLSKRTVLITEYAILTALVVVMQLLSNVLSFGPVQFSLSLVPLVVGAILVGPLCSSYLGFVLGIVNLVSSFSNPVLLALMNSSPIIYVLTCVGKTVAAGWVAGMLFKLLKNKNEWVGVFLAAIAAPIVNTGIFFIMMVLFFQNAIIDACKLDPGTNVVLFVITGFITFNFFIELGLNIILAPAFNGILKGVRKSKKKNA